MNIIIAAFIAAHFLFQQGYAGFTFISGDDSDDTGHCETTSSCNGLIVTMFTYAIALSEVVSPIKDVVAIGVNGGQALTAFTNWQTGQGFTADIIVTDNEIMTTVFTRYRLIYLPSNDGNTGGGITCAQLDILTNRSTDIINFVNVHKGSLMALTHEGCPGAYQFLAAALTTVSISIDTLNVQQELIDIVPTLFPTSLDHCCYHTSYSGPVGYGGLNVLATDPATDYPVILGGLNIRLSSENCYDLIDNDGDGLIDGEDPDCGEVICDDGIDNNKNGYIDCEDENCQRKCQGYLEFLPNISVVKCTQRGGQLSYEFLNYPVFANRSDIVGLDITAGDSYTMEDTMINCAEFDMSDFGNDKVLKVNSAEVAPERAYSMLQKFPVSNAHLSVISSTTVQAVYVFVKGMGFGNGNSSVYPAFSDWTENNATCSVYSDLSLLHDSNCSHVPSSTATNEYGWTLVNVTQIFLCQLVSYNQSVLNLLWTQDSNQAIPQVWHSSESAFRPMLIVYYS